MFAVIWRATRNAVRRVAAFFRRLVTNQPNSEYERIVFNALYSVGVQVRKGMAG